jgi:diguanylate cyclase (GGDEF)-like protein
MAVAYEQLAQAERSRLTERRGQRRRLGWIGATAASYAVDAVFLLLFFQSGDLPGAVPAAYGAGAALACAAFWIATSSGLNLRLRDPGMVLAQNLCGIALQFVVLFMAPQIAFPWLMNVMTVLAFAVVWFSFRQSLAAWALCCGLVGILFYSVPGRISMPMGSFEDRLLVWLYFSVVLGRCALLSVYSTEMRNRLAQSRSKLAASMAQVQELVSYDELTKAFNRRSLIARLEQERASAQRHGGTFSVALFDLDHFKSVNDRFGHAAGDEVLKAFVRTVHATMRDTDIFGRHGGEEFMMILPDTDLAGACLAVERVRAAVAQADWKAIGPELAVTVSAGVASWKRAEQITQVIGRADAALYEAKHRGRDRVQSA